MRVSPGQYAKNRHCGYCGGHGSALYGFEAFEMTAAEYQALVDRGFRRSGTFVYKPDLLRSCCPQYTVRLDAARFRASREQRQTLNRFNSRLGCAATSRKGKENRFDLAEAAYRAEHQGRLRVVVEAAGFSSAKYALYAKYQAEVHGDTQVSESQFARFLCDSPFVDAHVVAAHELYFLGDTLVALSVLDVLPEGLSSVYFAYDPAFRHLGAWGRVSALHDIAHTATLGRPYYYMGFYIHSCGKMRYKGAFAPSFLLDPWFSAAETQWYPLEQYAAALDAARYAAFNAARPVAAADARLLSSPSVADMPGVARDAWKLSRVALAAVPLLAPDARGNAVTTTVDGIGSPEGKRLVAQLIFTMGVLIGADLIEKVLIDFT